MQPTAELPASLCAPASFPGSVSPFHRHSPAMQSKPSGSGRIARWDQDHAAVSREAFADAFVLLANRSFRCLLCRGANQRATARVALGVDRDVLAVGFGRTAQACRGDRVPHGFAGLIAAVVAALCTRAAAAAVGARTAAGRRAARIAIAAAPAAVSRSAAAALTGTAVFHRRCRVGAIAVVRARARRSRPQRDSADQRSCVRHELWLSTKRRAAETPPAGLCDRRRTRVSARRCVVNTRCACERCRVFSEDPCTRRIARETRVACE